MSPDFIERLRLDRDLDREDLAKLIAIGGEIRSAIRDVRLRIRNATEALGRAETPATPATKARDATRRKRRGRGAPALPAVHRGLGA